MASRLANWDEVRQLVGVLGEENAGVFEIAGEDTASRRSASRLSRSAEGVGGRYSRPVTYGMFSMRKAPDYWCYFFKLADETADAGGRMFIQVHSRALNVVLSFETTMPFDKLPVWREIRKLPLAEQETALRNPEIRAKLIAAVHDEPRDGRPAAGPEPRRANFKWLFVMDKANPPHRSIAEIAEELDKDPVEVIIDLALEKEDEAVFLQPLANDNQDHVLEMMRNPRSVVTFSDRARTSRRSWTRRCRATC